VGGYRLKSCYSSVQIVVMASGFGWRACFVSAQYVVLTGGLVSLDQYVVLTRNMFLPRFNLI
jgi:hypothetical protein